MAAPHTEATGESSPGGPSLPCRDFLFRQGLGGPPYDLLVHFTLTLLPHPEERREAARLEGWATGKVRVP
ncbi:hypothetical protein, partial [Reyranella sp.]|uniref:hypothetical protein n=1 Tax=Reyranella sp. TaxID=1929291 RepID=UPI0040353521